MPHTCKQHSNWDIPQGYTCPDCLLEEIDSVEPYDVNSTWVKITRLKKRATECAANCVGPGWKPHIEAIAHNRDYGPYEAIAEARRLQGEGMTP